MNKKFLDLAGLTAYDKKLKNWHDKHIQDILNEEILELFT